MAPVRWPKARAALRDRASPGRQPSAPHPARIAARACRAAPAHDASPDRVLWGIAAGSGWRARAGATFWRGGGPPLPLLYRHAAAPRGVKKKRKNPPDTVLIISFM